MLTWSTSKKSQIFNMVSDAWTPLWLYSGSPVSPNLLKTWLYVENGRLLLRRVLILIIYTVPNMEKKSPSSIKPTRHKQTNKQTCICSHDMCYPLLPRNKSSVSFYTSFCCGGKRKKERKKNHPENLIVRPVLAFGVTDHSRSRGLDV